MCLLLEILIHGVYMYNNKLQLPNYVCFTNEYFYSVVPVLKSQQTAWFEIHSFFDLTRYHYTDEGNK